MSYPVRLYTNEDSFTKLIPIPAGVGEIHVALAFARDYDGDKSTNGKFIPYWDTYKVTPSVITQFKENAHPTKVKVLVSIGNRNAQYPFRIEAGQKDSWVSNATESLTSIIKRYNLDGIDVFYEYIESPEQDFGYCIGQLMASLKNKGTISVASIAPTTPLNSNFYFPMYQLYSTYIDTVVYQFFTEPKSITSVKSLAGIFNTISNQYPKKKLFAGYSTISRDWARVSPALYFIALFQFLIGRTDAGPAIWVISDSPARGVNTSDSVITSFVLERILEVVSLARNG